MGSALDILLPKILEAEHSFKIITFQGKADLLVNLPRRLEGYKRWIPNDFLIVVVVDRDKDDCLRLKARLESIASQKGLTTKSASRGQEHIHVLNRIVVEELEAWFFGDVQAISEAYPGVPATLASRSRFREADNIRGGTWEALEKVLQDAGYYSTGLPKIETAQRISMKMEPQRNRSKSFLCFIDGLIECIKINTASD